ncbi:biliverdin-producing heme oxygenase [Paenibacillus pasadenensis]|uniref:biliverdin-producing heme oxygenase n=1 Tax=Paenibacillus pasadenensis TaxID=217090 RepID=UPI0020419018|nr:biliverdin-producing heme oxygenase [Paenibacillus pasadenensis]MCM3748051.1 biliverdin-producing heme oxygenase [Paenibacillus pasadenensis]
MSTGIMERLREQTSEEHKRMENNEYAKAIMDGSMTREQYRRYLILFYGFIKAAENEIYPDSQLEELGLSEADRAKAPLIEQDLLYLGLTPGQIGELPLCLELPDLSATAKKLGYLYVLEGSTLGGQIISRKIGSSLQLEPGAGLSYFYAYGDETRSSWQKMREIIEQGAAGSEEQTITAAKETFRLLERWVVTAGQTLSSN